MISILHNPAETELDIRCITTETEAPEDLYSTTPLQSIHSIYRQPNEDELHSSFEEAISDRVLALNKQLSVPLIENRSGQSPINPVGKHRGFLICILLLRMSTYKAILHIAITLLLIMVGFDIMGLLVLVTSR